MKFSGMRGAKGYDFTGDHPFKLVNFVSKMVAKANTQPAVICRRVNCSFLARVH